MNVPPHAEDEARRSRQRAAAETERLRRALGWSAEEMQLVLVRTKELPYLDYPPEDQPKGYYPSVLIHPEGEAKAGEPIEIEEEPYSEYWFGNLGPEWIPPDTNVFCWQIEGEFYTIYGGGSGSGPPVPSRCACPLPTYEVLVDCPACVRMPKYWRISVAGYETSSDCGDPVDCGDILGIWPGLTLTYDDDAEDGCLWRGQAITKCPGYHRINIRLYRDDDYWYITMEDEDGCEFVTVSTGVDDFKCCGVNADWEYVSGECDGVGITLRPDPCTCCTAVEAPIECCCPPGTTMPDVLIADCLYPSLVSGAPDILVGSTNLTWNPSVGAWWGTATLTSPVDEVGNHYWYLIYPADCQHEPPPCVLPAYRGLTTAIHIQLHCTKQNKWQIRHWRPYCAYDRSYTPFERESDAATFGFPPFAVDVLSGACSITTPAYGRASEYTTGVVAPGDCDEGHVDMSFVAAMFTFSVKIRVRG